MASHRYMSKLLILRGMMKVSLNYKLLLFLIYNYCKNLLTNKTKYTHSKRGQHPIKYQ